MKKLHAIKDNGREYAKYFQVKNGFVYLTNGLLLLKMPAEEVFGKDIITDSDLFYFELKMWSILKFHSAKWITREGDVFRNSNGLTYVPVTSVQYPDVDVVVPERRKEIEAIFKYGLDAFEYFNLITAWGIPKENVRMWFYGETKGCILESPDSKGFAYLMPLNPKREIWDGFKSYPILTTEDANDIL